MAKQFIYHEKQSAALCGVHCLNNLLQGPYTNAGSLAEIAHELDAQERELMLSQGNKAIQNLITTISGILILSNKEFSTFFYPFKTSKLTYPFFFISNIFLRD